MSDADAMLTEIKSLAHDLEELAPTAFAQAAKLAFEPRSGPVILTGCGDSLIAAEAMAPAFERLSGRTARALFPREVHAGLKAGRIVGISASGSTIPVLNALARARAAGIPSLLLTGTAESEAGRAAAAQMVLPLTDKVARVPGIRSYQANLLGLLALAARADDDWSTRLKVLSSQIAVTTERCLPKAWEVAAILARSGSVVYLGEGSDFASAAYGVAKRMEASGQFGIVRETEEFWHLERFARDLKAVVLITSGGDTPDAVRMAGVAKDLGAQLIAIAPTEAAGVRAKADAVLTLEPAPDPLLAPFLAAIPLAALAAAEAKQLGFAPFRQDRPNKI